MTSRLIFIGSKPPSAQSIDRGLRASSSVDWFLKLDFMEFFVIYTGYRNIHWLAFRCILISKVRF